MIKSPKSYCFSDRPCRECRTLTSALLPTLRSIFLTARKSSHRRCVCRSASAVYQDSYRECTRPCSLASQLRFPIRQCTLLTALVNNVTIHVCNALCCQLRASHHYKLMQVAKGLFFRIPSLRSECYNLKRDFIIMCTSSLYSLKNTGGLVV
jgi:hypothetical protein